MDTSVQTTQHTKTRIPTAVGLSLTAAFGVIGLAAMLVSNHPQKEWQNYLTRMPGNQASTGTSLQNTNAGVDTTNTNTSTNANANTNSVTNTNGNSNANANTNTPNLNFNTNISVNANVSL